MTARLEPHVAAALAYVGGPLSGALVLAFSKSLVDADKEPFVRFHAMQSLLTFLGIAVLHLLLRSLPVVGVVAALPFLVAVIVLWVVLIVRALRGHVYKLPFVGEIAASQLR
jgi:uncharacterized membrane protein